MKRLLLASLPVMCLSVSCTETSSSDPSVGSGSSALSAAQCEYFEEGGKVTICHATGGPGSPVKKIRVGSAACENAHAAHPGDFIAIDGSCGPNTCLAENTPCDATLPCCEGLACEDGRCVEPPTCASEDFGSFGCDINIPDGSSVLGGLATMSKTIGAQPLAVYQTATEACEFSFGPCSTLNLDAGQHSILVAQDNVYEVTFNFGRPMSSFSIGKLYGLGITQVTFRNAGNVVLTEQVNRDPGSNPNIVCEVGTTLSWTPPAAFDEVELFGGIFAITDLGACTM